LEDCGAAGIVLPSIFEEEIEAEAAQVERLTTARAESFPEALSYFPAAIDCGTGPHEYLETIRRTREAVAVPVIASLNGASRSAWHDYAKLVEEAGASAIELNLYFVPSDLCLTGPEVEDLHLDALRSAKAASALPRAVKLSPYFSVPGNMAMALSEPARTGSFCSIAFTSPISI